MNYFLDIRSVRGRGGYRVHSIHDTLEAAAWAMRQHMTADAVYAARVRDAFTGEVLARATPRTRKVGEP